MKLSRFRNTFKIALLSTVFAMCLVVTSLHGAYAQTPSISGDEVCGSSQDTICKPADLAKIMRKVVGFAATVGGVVVFIFIIVRILSSVAAYMKGDQGAIGRARDSAFQALIGFIILICVFSGGFLILVQAFGTEPWVVQLLKFFSYGLVDQAYAAEQLLPNTYGSNSLYDIIISGANLIMRFFVYPFLIFIWVASGFKMVYSQGNPEGLKTARSWILIAVITTVVCFTLQGFILAFRGTAEKILPGSTTSQSSSTSSAGAQVSSAEKASATAAVAKRASDTGSPMPTDYTSCTRAGNSSETCAKSYPGSVPPGTANAQGICPSGYVADDSATTGCSQVPILNASANTPDCGDGFRYDPESNGCVADSRSSSDYVNGSDVQSDTTTNTNAGIDPLEAE